MLQILFAMAVLLAAFTGEVVTSAEAEVQDLNHSLQNEKKLDSGESLNDAPDSSDKQRIRAFHVGRIQVHRKNVFETGTDLDGRFPYSWANKLHVMTTESYIRRELLFREGDPFDEARIKESERLLRSRPIFRYVKIQPQEPINGTRDILIQTEDVWTTTIQLAYGTAGGKNFYTLGFLEHNLLGQGKSVGGFVKKSIDRFLRGVSYEDTQFLGSRWHLSGGYGRDEKGREWESRLEKPFYSVLVHHSEGASYTYREDEDRLFQDGEEAATFRHRTEQVRAFAAYSAKPSYVRVRRWILAHENQKDQFADAQSGWPLFLPEKRVISAVLLGYDFQNIRFHKIRGVRTFDRDEDINVGWEWLLEGGPSLEQWGATRDGAVGRFQLKKTLHPRESQVWFNHMDVDGRWENKTIQNGVARLRSHFYLREWKERNTASLRGEFITSKNLDPERQFLLGGENGLRGYSVRQFSGRHKILASIENRHVLVCDWLNLVSLGWAVFGDSGVVWDHDPNLKWNQVKSDVGAGIRLAPSRSFDPGLIRIDVAYALQDNNKSSPWVINIGADLSFGERRIRKFEQ